MSEITQLLKPLRVSGGTFYTFQPAMKDLALMMGSNDNMQFVFSKFVCVNLPEWANFTKQRTYINPDKLASMNDDTSTGDANLFFVKAYLQNYVNNFNAIADEYRNDNGHFATAVESSIFKALSSKHNNEYSAMSFEESRTLAETDLNVTQMYVEKTTDNYEPVVQYIGDINMVNVPKAAGNEYLEIFGYIPTSAGKMTGIEFKKNKNLSYTLGAIPSGRGEDWVAGQEDAFNNSTSESYARAVYDSANMQYSVAGDDDKLQINWDQVESDEFKQNNTEKGSFDMNAVILYYDIFDKNDMTNYSRNVYGIYILDSFDSSAPNEFTLKGFKKYQPDDVQGGNSYSFRFNIAFSGVSNIVTTANVINDFSTYSMQLYMRALEELRNVSLAFETAMATALSATERINKLEMAMLAMQKYSGYSDMLVVEDRIATLVERIDLDELEKSQIKMIPVAGMDAGDEASWQANVERIEGACYYDPESTEETSMYIYTGSVFVKIA